MTFSFDDLNKIDHKLILLLKEFDSDHQEILSLIEKRSKILHSIESKELQLDSNDRQKLVESTKFIMLKIEEEQSKLSGNLKEYRYAQRSLEQYKKFS